jgi:hypothetical protein
MLREANLVNEPRISAVDPSMTDDPAMLARIGYFVAYTKGQRRWLRTLNIDHHQIPAGTDALVRGTAQTLTEAAE